MSRPVPGLPRAPRVASLALAFGCLTLAACRPAPIATPAATPIAAAAVPTPAGAWAITPAFTDISAAAGLDFKHRNGMTGQRYFVEIVGAGGALFDYDGDGDLDLYLVQGSPLRPGPGTAAAPEAADSADPLAWQGRLYRNDLAAGPDGRPAPRFTDVTVASGIAATGYGMGAATADYDNDGDVDLYLTNWGANQLWRNNGDGSFSDVTAAAGADDLRWSVSAAWTDYDRDGWLDLYVANYVDYSYDNDLTCYSASGATDYCGPHAYTPTPDKLLRNRGDGSFEDVSAATGISAEAGAGLGVVATDANGDGWPDLYVANDGAENFLWLNEGGTRFTNRAAIAGAAVNGDGRPEGSMGVTASDIDNDGDDDLFMTNLHNETNTLYLNDGGVFRDDTNDQPLGLASLPFTGFGLADIDIDNDGWLDFAVANGEVTLIDAQAAAGDPFPLKQTNSVYRNLGGGLFADATAASGAAFNQPEVGRGLVGGDIDNDGDADLVVTNANGPARLLRNDAGAAYPWLGLRLVGTVGGRDMLGAVARLVRPSHTAAPGSGEAARGPLLRRAATDGSYASARDPRLLFGLGESSGPQSVEVTWPDGARERWADLAPGSYHTLVQGSGTP